MTCDRFDTLIDLYAAGELAPQAAAEFELHAADCPACRDQLAAAHRRIQALEAALGRFRAADGLVGRTMARVLAEAPREAEPEAVPETLVGRLGRYAALAAAAVLFLLAGYGFLRRQPTARYVTGPAARVGATAATLAPGAALSRGEVVATPASAQQPARFRFAGDRMEAWMRPGTIVRFADPRLGTVAHVARGGLLLVRRGSQGATLAVSTPLARVAALDGAVSVHVAPLPHAGGQPRAFRGVVTLAAHKGWARVQLAGQSRRVVTLRPGQALILRSGLVQPLRPLSADAMRQLLERRLRGLDSQLANLTRQWVHVSAMAGDAPREERPKLFIDGVRLQAMVRQATTARAEADRQLKLLEYCQDDYRTTLRRLQTGR